jgi:Tol biopolymer transport system component
MVWKPVFSPDGKRLAAKAERNGKFALVLDGKPGKTEYDGLEDPVFRANGDRMLLRTIERNQYVRKVVSVVDL